MYTLNKCLLRRKFIYGEKAEQRCEKQSRGNNLPNSRKAITKGGKGKEGLE
jgi:hypothetical protein